MKFSLKNTLASIVLASAIGLIGCSKPHEKHYEISQRVYDKLAEMPVKDWIEYTDSSINLQRLIKDGKYEEAQFIIKKYLKQQAERGAEYDRDLKATDKVSKPVVERVKKTVDMQMQKINTHLQ